MNVSCLLHRAALSALILLMLTSLPAAAQTRDLRVHTANPGSSAFAFTTTMQRIAERDLPLRMNVTAGMNSARSTLDAARGQVDFFIQAPAINHYMQNRQAMFKDMANAPELAKNVRSVLDFTLGPFHIITYADSGIETLEDIKGKRVFAGPPGGSATTVGLGIIESITGYKPGVDFQLSRLDWNSGNQAFQDRQVDLAIIPTELPSASIQQFALLSEIRLIGLPEDKINAGALSGLLSMPGRSIVKIPPDIYGANQVNEMPVAAIASWIGLGTHIGEDEETVYGMTRSIFENLEEFHDTAEWMKSITLESAFTNMNAPLHKGALRYYREAGVEIPDHLIPPEAR